MLLAVVVVRTALVAQYAELRPAWATAAWPSNPQAELWSGLTDIASATRTRRAVPPAVFERIEDAAKKAPLAAEPFLVRGVQARLAGDEDLAGRAFAAAELRDGRSVPARYFLADHDLRTGDVTHGLGEISVLSRMIPNGPAALSPFVATYAKDRRNWPRISALFRSDPQLAEAVLASLAADPSNSDTVLQLAPPKSAESPHLWVGPLLAGLVQMRDYEGAYRVWRSLGGRQGSAGETIHDPGFTDSSSPGPFNWTLTSSAIGLAERQKGGRLHLLYYAREDGVLASQLLLLKPGRYRLAMQVSGDVAHSARLTWTITCADSGASLLRLALSPTTEGSFIVPGGCAAQRLELAGSAPEMAQTVDVVISGVTLAREQAGG